MYLFLGLIVGTLLPFTKELKWNIKSFILFIVFLSLTFIISFMSTNTNFIFTGSLLDYLYTSFLGIIDAFTSIVPGISGTAIFMLLGSYEYVLKVLSNPFSLLFIIYGIGLILGIIIICYIMNYLLKYKRNETNIVIFAFMISSVGILLIGIKSIYVLNIRDMIKIFTQFIYQTAACFLIWKYQKLLLKNCFPFSLNKI